MNKLYFLGYKYHGCINSNEMTKLPKSESEFGTRVCGFFLAPARHNISTVRCSKLKRSVEMTSSGKNGLNIRTNASPTWDRTKFSEE